jgi:hypothetical protein
MALPTDCFAASYVFLATLATTFAVLDKKEPTELRNPIFFS